MARIAPNRPAAALITALLALAGHAHAQCTVPKWIRLTPENSPPARHAAAFAFDRNTGLAVLYGGIGVNGRLGDTWVWDGTNWTQKDPTIPQNFGPQSNSAAGFSSFYNQVVMHGGLTANATASAAAFRFNPTGNGAWIPMSSNVGLARYNHTITNTGNTMVIAGGIISPCSFGNSGLIFRTTDFFTTAGFTDQHAVQTHGAFYRSAGDTLHLVAGSLIETNCNFVLNNGTSDSALFPNVNGTNQIRTLQANPFSARNNIGLADDFVANRVVLFGGASLNNFPSPTGLLGDTWIRNPAGTWTLLNTTPGQAPVPRRAFNTMVFDSVRNQILLFGGHNGEPLGDTWVLTWTTVITAQPKSIASPGPTPVGANAILRVAADGPSALTYQWRRNGVPITNGINPNGSAYLGANTDTLQISGVTWEDDTNYDVVINSACGSITSNPVRLRVASPLCYSNCDGSRSAEGLPTLSPADFACFLNRYRNAFTSTPEAVAYVDCNSDGSISPADFSCFLTKYRAGCP